MTTGQPLSVASIAAGAEAVGVALSDLQAEALLQYAELLLKWNKVYNLTSLRDPREVLTLHLIDSLSGVAALRRAIAGRRAEWANGVLLCDGRWFRGWASRGGLGRCVPRASCHLR